MNDTHEYSRQSAAATRVNAASHPDEIPDLPSLFLLSFNVKNHIKVEVSYMSIMSNMLILIKPKNMRIMRI